MGWHQCDITVDSGSFSILLLSSSLACILTVTTWMPSSHSSVPRRESEASLTQLNMQTGLSNFTSGDQSPFPSESTPHSPATLLPSTTTPDYVLHHINLSQCEVNLFNVKEVTNPKGSSVKVSLQPVTFSWRGG